MLEEHNAKRRKVRKGTHSCWECRRRKVKCIFATADDVMCITCARRGSECVGQDTLDTSREDYSPRRDGHNRGAVSRGSIDLGSYANGNDIATTSRVSSLFTPNESHQSPNTVFVACALCLNGAPNGSHRSGEPQAPHRSVQAERCMHEEKTQALLKALPCREDIIVLSKLAENFSMLCSQSGYRTRQLTDEDLHSSRKCLAGLLDPESHPVLLARQMLLFAASLRHLSRTEVIPKLRKHHHRTVEDLAEAAITIVTMQDSLVGSLEGLENLILECFYHIDSGNIRRAWMTIRRAVMVGQILGVQDPGRHRFKCIKRDDDLDPTSMWTCILSVDRILSLLLGLPPDGVVTEHASQNTTHDFRRGLCTNIAAQILSRNQIRDYNESLAVTQRIDQELIDVAERMPSEFWRPLSFAGVDLQSVTAFLEIQRVWDHMCFYSFVIQLHLPHILCPVKTRQSVYSRIACANASREVLSRQIAIRSLQSAAASCRLGDFMALIAGMTLILVHTVSHHDSDRSDNILAHQRVADRAIIEDALHKLKLKPEGDDVLETKCATLLQELLSIEAEAASIRSRKHSGTVQCKLLSITVPYVGTIHVGCDGVVAIPVATDGIDQEMCGDLVVGGLGSIGVKDGSIASIAGKAGVFHGDSPCFKSLSDLRNGGAEQGGEFESLNHVFPDATASIDDWTFQGTDTAFFDNLLRGFDGAPTSV